jgi:tetratricopeptide (TPR) repeat protein
MQSERAWSAALFSLSLVLVSFIPCAAQTSKPAPNVGLQQVIDLAASGHCKEAVPLLKRSLPQASNLRYGARMALLRCAMALDEEQLAADTLLALKHDAPNDPQVLYMATHYFSELGMRAAQQLQATAPNSDQAHRLEAESLESQGKSDDAAAIYRNILEADPKTPGIH